MASSASSTASGEPTDSAGSSRDVSDMEALQVTIRRERYASRCRDPATLLPRLPPRLELPHLVLGHLIREVEEQQELTALNELGSALSSVWTHPDAPDHLVRALIARLRRLPDLCSPPEGLLQALAIHSGPRFFCHLQEALTDERWLRHEDLISWALYLGVLIGADHIARFAVRWTHESDFLAPCGRLASRVMHRNQLAPMVQLLEALSILIQRMRPRLLLRQTEVLLAQACRLLGAIWRHPEAGDFLSQRCGRRVLRSLHCREVFWASTSLASTSTSREMAFNKLAARCKAQWKPSCTIVA